MELSYLDELIERNTPKKVIKEVIYMRKGFEYNIIKCPNCKEHLYAKDNFCKDCGQRLDWGNNND